MQITRLSNCQTKAIQRFIRYLQKIILLSVFLAACAPPAQANWQLKLTLIPSVRVQLLSAVSSRVAWVMTSNKRVMVTVDGGKTWLVQKATGLGANLRFQQLVALDGKTALLAANKEFTGAGPGIIFRTTDGGLHWLKVFTHELNCDFKLAMAGNKGLLAVNFTHFSGGRKPGQALLQTRDGGKSWSSAGISNPSHDFYIRDLFVKDQQAWLHLEGKIFYSSDFGKSWSIELSPEIEGNPVSFMQFITPQQGIFNASALIDLYIKRPPDNQWEHLGDPTTPPVSGAVTALLIDGNECWLSEAFDHLANFYSNDYCASFSPFMLDPNSAFRHLQKIPRGKTLWAATPHQVYVNHRKNLQ